MTTTAHDTTLILGATGKTGSRVADRLRQRGRAVRLGSRSGTPRFDWDDCSTWPEAARGTTAAYLSYYPDVAVPGAAQTVAAFAETALAQGVRRLVLLSGRLGPGRAVVPVEPRRAGARAGPHRAAALAQAVGDAATGLAGGPEDEGGVVRGGRHVQQSIAAA